MSYLISGTYLILERLSFIYLTFKPNCAFCIFIYAPNLASLLKHPDSEIFEEHWYNIPTGDIPGHNSKTEKEH